MCEIPQHFLKVGVLSSVKGSSNKYQRKETPKTSGTAQGVRPSILPLLVNFHIISIPSL